jgi:hypothetical protein
VPKSAGAPRRGAARRAAVRPPARLPHTLAESEDEAALRREAPDLTDLARRLAPWEALRARILRRRTELRELIEPDYESGTPSRVLPRADRPRALKELRELDGLQESVERSLWGQQALFAQRLIAERNPDRPAAALPVHTFYAELHACAETALRGDELRLDAIVERWRALEPLLLEAARVKWRRLPEVFRLFRAAAAEQQRLETRHADAPKEGTRRRLLHEARTDVAKDLRRLARATARNLARTVRSLKPLGRAVEAALRDAHTDGRRTDAQTLHALWQLVTDAPTLSRDAAVRIPGAPSVTVADSVRQVFGGPPDGGVPAVLEVLAGALRLLEASSPAHPPPRRRRGAPSKPALAALRRELAAGLPGRWTKRHRAEVVAAVLFAAGLARRVDPDGVRRSLARGGADCTNC